MDTNLSFIFNEICIEIGCQESEAAPALKILNDNFFFRLRDIKNLNIDLWRQLGLPLNLFFILNEKIKIFESSLTDHSTGSNLIKLEQPQNSVKITSINQSVIKEIPRNEDKNITAVIQSSTADSNLVRIPSKINENQHNPNGEKTVEHLILSSNKIEIHSHDYLKKDIYNVLDNLALEINSKDRMKEVLKNLHKIIINIISNPNDEKFRKLNAESKFFQNTINPYKNTLKFLELLQFTKISNQYIEYTGDYKYLIDIGERLNEYLIDRKYAECDSSFNPYESHVIGTAGLNADMKKIEQPDFDELIKKERERRDEIVKNSKTIERNTIVFTVKSGDFMGAIKNMNSDEEKEVKSTEEADYLKYAMNIIKSNSDKFVVKRRTDFENLIKKPVYNKAVIRIKFPNELLLQSNFAMMETVGDIYEFVRQNLFEPNQEFSLFTPFPRKVYNDKKATIYSQALAPSTLLYITFPNIDAKQVDYPYLSQECVGKFISSQII